MSGCGCSGATARLQGSSTGPCPKPTGSADCACLLVPARGLVTITPSDEEQQFAEGVIARSVFVGAGGVICLEAADGSRAALTVPDGAELHIQVRRIRSTHGTSTTTATGIVAYL